MNIADRIIPARYKYIAFGLLLVSVFMSGFVYGVKTEAEPLADYIAEQSSKTVALTKVRHEIIIQKEVKWRDRIQVKYLIGEQIEKNVKDYISPVANAACVINDGFVRVHDSAWTSTDTGAAAITDDEPAGISLAQVGEVTAHNAKACIKWKEVALGLRDTYEAIRKSSVK